MKIIAIGGVRGDDLLVTDRAAGLDAGGGAGTQTLSNTAIGANVGTWRANGSLSSGAVAVASGSTLR